MNEYFSITNHTKSRPLIKDLLFVSIKDDILGKNYSLSLVYIGDARMKKINNKYRQKNYATDILSFSLSNDEGEIFIDPNILKKKSADFDMTPKQYTVFLFIHGCLHLKGYDHGEEMEKLEKKYTKSYLQKI